MFKTKKIFKIIIWVTFTTPFFLILGIMYFVSINTISYKTLKSNEQRKQGLIYFSDLENPKNNLATKIYSADGMVLGEYFIENRSKISYSEISPNLIEALISTEDIRFRTHSGIDLRGLLRAIYGTLIGNNKGGGSTITQQLAKMLFTERPSSGLDRVQQKLKEWVVAVELERRYSKNEIITMYLNRFDWINQAVGIKSAAKVYFSTTPEDLTINEAAMLVGMLQNPSLYNPNRRPEITLERRNVVLSQMLKYGKISKEQYESLKIEPLGIKYKKIDHNEGLAPYLRERLRSQLTSWCRQNKKPNGEEYNLYTDGLVIQTTIDSKMQAFAEESVKERLVVLQKEFNHEWEGVPNAPFPEDFSEEQKNDIINQAIKRSERYKKLKKRGKNDKEIKEVFNTKVEMSLFSWEKEIDTLLSPKDSILYNKYFIHAGVMSMDPNTGHVKAYVGGIDHKFFKYDHVLQGKRQVGSTFKPFLYALAMQEGMSPCDEILNSSVVFNAEKWGLEKDWIPKNSGKDAFGGLYLPIKFGLANSINVMTAYIMHQYGPKAVIDMAKKMGIKSKILPVPSVCLGTFDITVSEMAGAYSTFVNQGVYTEPIIITRIIDKNGVVIQDFYPETKEALSEKTAALMIQLLMGAVKGSLHTEAKTGVDYFSSDKNHKKQYKRLYDKELKKDTTVYITIPRGTGMRLLGDPYKLNNEIGGKTGTTQDYSDGWFVGITPNLVTTVWTGCEDRSVHFRKEKGKSNTKGYGSYTALPIFGKYMRKIYNSNDKLVKEAEDNRKKELSLLSNIKQLTSEKKRREEEINKKYDLILEKIIILESNTFNYSSRQVEVWAKNQMECNKKIDISFETQNEEY
tara:strand:- start:2890 stop:5451 length:2562 start_codon:yes stop_codon:yes gene_type:complete